MLPEIKRSVGRMHGSERAQFALVLGHCPEDSDDFPISEPSLDVQELLQLIDLDQLHALDRFAPFLEHNPRVIRTLDPASIREILLPVINSRQVDVDGTDIPDDEPYTLELVSALQSIVPSVSFSAIGAPFAATARAIATGVRFIFGIPTALLRAIMRGAGALGRALVGACRAVGLGVATVGKAILMPFIVLGRAVLAVVRFIAGIPASFAEAIVAAARAFVNAVKRVVLATTNRVRNAIAALAAAIRDTGLAIRNVSHAFASALRGAGLAVASALRGAGLVIANAVTATADALRGALRAFATASSRAVAEGARAAQRAISSGLRAFANAAATAGNLLTKLGAQLRIAAHRVAVILAGATRRALTALRQFAQKSASRGSISLHDGLEAGVRASRNSAKVAKEAAVASRHSAHVFGEKTGAAIAATREISRKRFEASSHALTEFGMVAGTALFGSTDESELRETKFTRAWKSAIDNVRASLLFAARPIAILACGTLIVILSTTIVAPLLRELHARTQQAVRVAAAAPHAVPVQHHHVRVHHAATPKHITARAKIHAKAPIRIAAIPHARITPRHRKRWKFDPQINPFTSESRVALKSKSHVAFHPSHRAPRAVADAQIPANEPHLVSRARLIVTSYLASLMRGDASTALGHLGLSANAPVSNLSEGPVVQRAAGFRIVHASLRNGETAKVDVEITGPQGNYFGVYTVQANGPAAWITDHTVIPTTPSVGYTVRNR